MFGRGVNVRVEKKFVKVDGGGMGSKDDWEVGMSPKPTKKYQKDLKEHRQRNGRDRGRTMTW